MIRSFFPIVLSLHFCLGSVYSQQAGELDVEFGTDGISIVGSSLSENYQTRAITITSGNYIVIIGRVQTLSGIENDILVARFTTSGLLDSVFGENGLSVLDFGGSSGLGQDLATYDDGGILTAVSNNSSGSFESNMLALTNQGLIDQSFGVGGVASFETQQESSTLFKLISDGNNGFIGAGSIYGSESLLYVVKVDAHGQLNEQFGNLGLQTVAIAPFHNPITDILTHSNGKVVATNSGFEFTAQSETYTYGQAWQLNADGTWDTSFGGDGKVNIELSNTTTGISGIEQDSQSRFIIVGNAETNDGFQIFVSRLGSDGSFDTGFGAGGVNWVDNPSGATYGANTFVLQPNGKIIIGGSANDGNDDNFCLIRLNEDGSLDPTFGNNGIVITEVSEGYDAIADMELQADGKLVVGGTARVGNNDDIVLARYHTGLNISVNEIDEKPLFSVYPNPVSNLLTIKAEKKLEEVELFDAMGRTVISQKISAIRTQLDISYLPSGIYLLQATDGKTLFSQRVVKE